MCEWLTLTPVDFSSDCSVSLLSAVSSVTVSGAGPKERAYTVDEWNVVEVDAPLLFVTSYSPTLPSSVPNATKPSLDG